MLRLYNNSTIRFVNDNQIDSVRGIGDIDYAIIDEAQFLKKYSTLRNVIEATLAKGGKIVETYTLVNRKRDEDFDRSKKFPIFV